jgi:hypothetical protein
MGEFPSRKRLFRGKNQKIWPRSLDTKEKIGVVSAHGQKSNIQTSEEAQGISSLDETRSTR